MKKTKLNILALASAILAGSQMSAQSSAVITETYNVSGNCGMCKKTIEKAALQKSVKEASWDESAKVLTLTYNKNKIQPEEILRAVAYAGYDNEKYLAPEAAYKQLPGCCRYDRPVQKEAKEAAQPNNQHAGHQPATADTQQQKESGVTKIYDQYFALKDALVKGAPAEAATSAKQMLGAIESVNMSALADKEHQVYMKQMSGLQLQTKKIAESQNLEKQRLAFSSLSETLYELMKTIKPAYDVYVDHCPMYRDGKGANWLSREKPIKNPYYGSKMMTCGNVTETIK